MREAVERLFISRPTLSHNLKKLEFTFTSEADGTISIQIRNIGSIENR